MYVYSNNFIEKKIFEVALLCNHHLCDIISYTVNLLCTYICMYIHMCMTGTIVFNIINCNSTDY